MSDAFLTERLVFRSLTVRHNYGADLLSSYRVDTSDEGIVIHKRLRMGTAEGFMFTGDRERVSLSSEVIYEEEDVRTAILTARIFHTVRP